MGKTSLANDIGTRFTSVAIGALAQGLVDNPKDIFNFLW